LSGFFSEKSMVEKPELMMERSKATNKFNSEKNVSVKVNLQKLFF